MKNVSIRLEDELLTMLSEVSVRPTTAVQTSVELMLYIRRATIHELKGRFTREEITALTVIFKTLSPTWKILINPSVLVMQIEDAEKYQKSVSNHGANPSELINKIKSLSAAEAAILQLELWIFWNHNETSSPDLETLIQLFS